MNYGSLMLSISSMICSIAAVLVMGEILPPMEPSDLTVGLLILMALFFVYVAANNTKGVEDGDQEES